MIDRARQEVLAAPHAPATAIKVTNQLPAEGDSTLVPMLVSGLVLVVIAMVGVMMFA
ncbi:hypothetical protein [Bosea rubneri]|uniref:Uncharacterized protein n=1 Tax=Bosea rubneri TaxID=3075434 RepID=A0ABU3S9F3_9HYPH|nr:hypothetical protein [Bosea sp. ZW T0_25]MDU0341420.1 hypothetical protein [Bosea sp. ZW T0_25]